MWAIESYFCHLATCTSTMPVYFNLDLKIEVVSLNVQTQNLSSDLNLVFEPDPELIYSPAPASNFFNFKFLHLQISSTSKLFNFKFLQLQIPLTSNFFNFNFFQLQMSSTSNYVNFKFLQFQISSPSIFFTFSFLHL